ncbi:MAG: methyltransferase domain-containing protein [Chloroflexota bacterium]|nr:methyltransferase domain-containing protein [Chloroflexota bacterium]
MPANNFLFDHSAPFYDRLIPPPDPQRLQAFLNLPTEGWLLEAGGGTGRIAALLAPLVGRLVVSDLSGPMLAESMAKTIACPVQADVSHLPFPDGHFDRVLVVDALHHFSYQQQAVAELVRVLKPGGRLVIEEPDITQLQVKFVALAEKVALMGSHFHSPDEIAAMIADCGLPARIEKEERFAAWIIADKK